MKKIASMTGDLLKIISSNVISFLGAVICATAVMVFFVFLGVSLFTMNHYVGILGFAIIPAFFVFGLILIPFGFFVYRKRLGFDNIKEVSPSKLMDKLKLSSPKGIIGILAIITVFNLAVLAIAGYESFHYMESNEFCGTLCHKVMSPEYQAYQDSSHSRVACVECHIGSGVGPLVQSKISGTRQMVAIMLNTYHRPIHTPLHNLRPAMETCEHCHWPEKFHGKKIRNILNYDSDEKNTPNQTVLLMNIGSGDPNAAHGIHWHVSKDSEVKYISENDERENIQWVELTKKDGTKKVWSKKGFEPSVKEIESARLMDCVDCHNRATHTYETINRALRRAMSMDKIDTTLPFIRREAEKALKNNNPDKEKAVLEIKTNLRKFYSENYAVLYKKMRGPIEDSINEIVKIYVRNINPKMKITWGTYPNHIGHEEFPGCFRCHNTELLAKDESYIDYDCELCHSIIRYGEPNPKTVGELVKQQ